ncbi:hypothetical protein FM038_024310 [Shewanella eurypsychrophilus]|uniref:RiboL-PSP-HEPN domain-containing protein n=1 Tax=Shewanella eurypsychrophilus TaxID=2593656 RepID=A0ABX6VDP7_9GAMM|nr:MULTISPECIES: hypothetical protein [Shewanella]QFU24938.1 hypothetical protein FS418_25950 [Shewanella sp. YLB-09]QPG60120.1 hypothetical protein FM038_024310 [Shewanella eurypsychrophilus]
MEQDDLDLENWEKAVGKIVSSVARLEGELLLKYETHNELSRAKYFNVDKSLSKRFDKVKSLYNSECGISYKANALFEEFDNLVELRNLVAHNPVFYESADKGFRITNGQSKSKYINISQISELAEHAFSTGMQLTVLFRVWQ